MSYGFIVAASRGFLFSFDEEISFPYFFFLIGSEKLGTYWLAWLALQLFLIAVLFVVIGLMIGLDNNDAISISVSFLLVKLICLLVFTIFFLVLWKTIICSGKHNHP